MKKIYLSIALVATMLTSCKKEETTTVDTTVKDTTAVVVEEAPAQPMDSAAMMKAWEAYTTPGEPHKMFAMDNGTWDEEATFYMSPNDPNPMKAKMTAVNRMILGGRFQESRHTGNVMGEQFEGFSVMGYNNASNKIESTWVDNMSTGVTYLTGTYDSASKTTELRGEVTDPMTGKAKAARETYTIVDDNTRKMEMFDVDANGKEYKSMEIVMTRRK